MILLELTQQEADALEALLRHFEIMKADVGSYDAVVDLVADNVENHDPTNKCELGKHLGAHLNALEQLAMSAIALRPRDFALDAVLTKLQSPRKARIA